MNEGMATVFAWLAWLSIVAIILLMVRDVFALI